MPPLEENRTMPYEFLSRNRIGSSMSSQSFGLCRGGILSNFQDLLLSTFGSTNAQKRASYSQSRWTPGEAVKATTKQAHPFTVVPELPSAHEAIKCLRNPVACGSSSELHERVSPAPCKKWRVSKISPSKISCSGKCRKNSSQKWEW